MTETATSRTLQTLTKHLLRQPTPRATLAEYLARLRDHGLAVVHPRDSAAPLVDDSPLIVHVPGNSARTVIVVTGYAPPPASPGAERDPDRLARQYRLERSGEGVIYGPGVLSTYAPLAIFAWLASQCRTLGDELPGSLLLVVAPGMRQGGGAFSRTGELVGCVLREHRLRPVALIAPAQPRADVRARSATRRKREAGAVFTTSAAGLLTLQVLVAAPPGGTSGLTPFRTFDPAALAATLAAALVEARALAPRLKPPLPPPRLVGFVAPSNAGPGEGLSWCGFRLALFCDTDEPSALLETVSEIARQTFADSLDRFRAHFVAACQAAGLTDEVAPDWRPLVLSPDALRASGGADALAQPLRRTTDGGGRRDDSSEPSLLDLQEAVLERLVRAYRASSVADQPAVVIAVTVPTFAPCGAPPEDDPFAPIVARTAKEFAGRVATAGGLMGPIQALAETIRWSGKTLRAVTDHAALAVNADEGGDFGFLSSWPRLPLIGLTPSGRDEGRASERLYVTPSFTRIPEALRTLVVRLMAAPERATIIDSVMQSVRRFSRRFSQRVASIFKRPRDTRTAAAQEQPTRPASAPTEAVAAEAPSATKPKTNIKHTPDGTPAPRAPEAPRAAAPAETPAATPAPAETAPRHPPAAGAESPSAPHAPESAARQPAPAKAPAGDAAREPSTATPAKDTGASSGSESSDVGPVGADRTNEAPAGDAADAAGADSTGNAPTKSAPLADGAP